VDPKEAIIKAKEETGALVLAHNYTLPEIQDIADIVGDSLGLAREAQKRDASLIAVCGVAFMAETVKILNPAAKVVMPDARSDCPMARQLNPDQILAAKEENPDAQVVLYVNTTAECKAYSDCMCTSSNPVKVVNSMDSDKIIFGPDENLAHYVASRTKKEILPIPVYGGCPVHKKMDLRELDAVRGIYPNAKVVVHPECPPEVQEAADEIASTGGILDYCRKEKGPFIIGTENGMLYRLKQENPTKEFYPLSIKGICDGMKLSTLEGLAFALSEDSDEIIVPDEIAVPARKSIERMLKLP